MKKWLLLLFFLTQVFLHVNADSRGGFSFGYAHAPVMSMSPAFIHGGGGPGGIAFENTAIPVPELNITSLKLSYEANQPDGSRMKLAINGHPVSYQIYDWELLPVAGFSQSPYVACFTYFGELTDKNLESVILNNEGHILNYHSDFLNTLLGWRLSDMDLLILYDFTTDLPKDKNNRYYLGEGEKVPDVTANKTAQNNYLIYLDNIQNDLGYVFRSYVLGDYTQKTEISIRNDSLKLSGNPYYYCWRFRQDFTGYNIQHVGDSIAARYQSILQKKKTENPNFYERGLYIDSLISLSEKYVYRYHFYESGTFVDMVSLETREAKRIFLEQYYTSDLKAMLVETEAYMDAFSAVYLKEFSDRMSSRPDLISAINPAVWHATITAMRTSAFFRYVREKFPDEWQSFVNQIANVQVSPEVRTPTVLYKTGNTVVEQALADYNAVSSPLPENPGQITLYPNPVRDVLTIGNLKGTSQISLYSSEGKNLRESVTGEENYRMDLRDLSPGIYLLQIRKEHKVVFTEKIIKSHVQ